VWGPSEVNAWINAVHPSRRAPSRRPRRIRPRIRRLRFRLLDAPVDAVREGIAEGFDAIGFPAATGGGHRVAARAGRRYATASIYHSILWRGIVVSIRFEPPLDRSASRHMLHVFTKRFRVVDVSSEDA